MATPVILTNTVAFTVPADVTLTGVAVSHPNDTAVNLKLNGTSILQTMSFGGDGSNGVLGFIPLKISLKTGMTLQQTSSCVLSLYFS